MSGPGSLPKVEGVSLGLGATTGAIIVYVKKKYKGRTIDLKLDGNSQSRMNANVVERIINGRKTFAAVLSVRARRESCARGLAVS